MDTGRETDLAMEAPAVPASYVLRRPEAPRASRPQRTSHAHSPTARPADRRRRDRRLVAGLAPDQAPTSSWSDARITAWYAANGNGHWLLSAYLIAAAAPFLLIFTAVVRERLARAGASATSLSVVLGAGTAFAVTLLTGAALYAAVPAARVFARAPAPSPTSAGTCWAPLTAPWSCSARSPRRCSRRR